MANMMKRFQSKHVPDTAHSCLKGTDLMNPLTQRISPSLLDFDSDQKLKVDHIRRISIFFQISQERVRGASGQLF